MSWWKSLLSIFIFAVLAGCNTVVFEYTEPVYLDGKKYAVRDETEEKVKFLKSAKPGEGYYLMRMRFLPVSHSNLPDDIKSKAKNTITTSDACRSKVKDLQQKEITGFAGIYVGDPITREDLENSKTIRDRVKLGHYFVMIDPESGTNIECYVDEQDYVLTSVAPWKMDALKFNLIWFNNARIDAKVGDVASTLRDIFKLSPVDHVFDLAELVAVDKGAERVGELINNYLSNASLSLKPQSFQINSAHNGWDQITRRYLELEYFVRDDDNKIIGDRRTVGFVELQFEAQPTILGVPLKASGYPDFSGLKTNALPKEEVSLNGESVDLYELILKQRNGLPSYDAVGAINTFQAKCLGMETALTNSFKLARIDSAAMLALFAAESYPEVFASTAAYPVAHGLPQPIVLTNDKPRDKQEQEQKDRYNVVKQRLDELKGFEAFFTQSCLKDYLELMNVSGTSAGENYQLLKTRRETVEARLAAFSFDFPPLTPAHAIDQIGGRFTRTFKTLPADRETDDFKWVSDSLEFRVLSNRPADLDKFGQAQTLSREQFVEATKGLKGQLGCYLNIKEKDLPADAFSMSEKHFHWPGFNMAAIYDDLRRDEPGVSIGNTGYAIVLMRFNSAGNNDLPQVDKIFVLNPEMSHLDLIERKVQDLPCKRDQSQDGTVGLLYRAKKILAGN